MDVTATAGWPADFAQLQQQLKNEIQQGLAAFLPDKEPRSLYEPMRYAMAAGGKQLRPMLLLLSCAAVGGSKERALPAALSLELVHNFTLVHDDIMDHDVLRRGRETVYKKWQESTALLAGDALLVQAFAALAALEEPLLSRVLAEYTAAILEVCEGQALDKEYELSASVTMDEYYHMIAQKTGRLFSLACSTGGLVGYGSAAQIRGLAEYGGLLGRAFQIQDDVLDLVAQADTLGKDIGSDIRENKKSFLLVHLYQYAPAGAQQQIRDLSHKSKLDPADVREAVSIFTKAGTLQAAESEIDRCIEEARTALKPLTSQPAKEQLLYLLTQLSRRRF